MGSYHSTAGDEARLRNSRIENSLESRILTRFSTSWSLNEGLKKKHPKSIIAFPRLGFSKERYSVEELPLKNPWQEIYIGQ